MATIPAPSITEAEISTTLEDGTRVCIRPVRSSDEARMRHGISQLSSESRYLRFFSVQPMPPDAVIERLIDADGEIHLAWGAIAVELPGQPAIGAVHAVRQTADSPSAEFSVAIVDAFHGLGLARMLIAVLLMHCRLENIATLDVHTLSENRAARNLFTWLGAERSGSDSGVFEYVLDTDKALQILRAETGMPQLQAVFGALAAYR